VFQGIDDIDWSKLEHAYGPATDVPALLRALLDDEEREGAMHALHGNIFHQSTRYQATPHAVPFIVEIVNDASLSRATREAALTLLTNVTAGWLSPNTGPFNADGGPEQARPGAAPFECDTSLEIRRAIDAAAAKAIVSVRALLDHDAPSLRARAASFLALFRTRAQDAEIVHALERRLAREEVPQVRTAIAFALGHVLPLGNDSLRALLAPNEHGAVRAMSAILLARRGARDELVSDALMSSLDAGDDVDEVFTSTPVTTEGVAGEAARAIGLLGAGARVLPRLTEKLRTVSGFEAVNLLEAALSACFPGDAPAPADAAALTEPQRSLLSALVQNDEGFWSVGNALNVLMDRGLPSMREEMASFLGVTFTHDQAREEVRHAEMMLHSFHDAERALEHLERALEANPKLGRAHLLKGFALLEIEDVEGALDSFRTSIPLVDGEEQLLARKNTAVLLGDLDRRDEALPYLEQNVAAAPGSSVAWYDLGLSLVKAGEHTRCIDAIHRCLAIQPDVANAHYTIACAYALRATTAKAHDGDVERALQAIKAAVELDDELKDSIRDDDDFASIRNDARFVALVGGRA
jgi:tetratricopeptide (TPR) repeat protein